MCINVLNLSSKCSVKLFWCLYVLLIMGLCLSLSVIDVCSDYRGHCRQIQLSPLRRISFYGFEESMDTCWAPVNEMPLNWWPKSRKPSAGIQMLSVCRLSLINVLSFYGFALYFLTEWWQAFNTFHHLHEHVC